MSAEPAAPTRRGHDWLMALGSIVVVLLAAAPGWLVLLALTIPADRGEKSSSVFAGIIGAALWAALVVTSAALASRRRRAPKALIFIAGLALSVGVTVAPLVSFVVPLA